MVALEARPKSDEPIDKPRSRPTAAEADAWSNVSALLLGPRSRPALAAAVTVFGSSGPMVAFTEELRFRSAPTVALATRPIPLEPMDSPRSTAAVTDGTIARDAETSIRVMVLLPTPTPTPALPPSPIEGVIAASTQMLSTFPPAEHDVDGTEVVAVGRKESAMPKFRPMLALACTPTPPVPTEIPRSALAATEGAIAKVADASTTVMVLLPRPTLITPPAPIEGVIVASRQMSSRLS
jgi:hypothetical protein